MSRNDDGGSAAQAAPPRSSEPAVATVAALVAFAANSILTRLALGAAEMDAASFTTVRITAGALVLAAIVRAQSGSWAALRGGARDLIAPLALFAYAAFFSFAYVRIGAAVGALLLFGAVQLTMIARGILAGERPRPRVWLALAVAAAGLAWLVLPAVKRPDPAASALMILAGCAWGVYSLVGRGATQPLAANARSFVWAVPLALLLSLATASKATIGPRGLLLAVTSGAVTSGLGYAIWYRALRGLTATQAAVVQLSVPVIAAFGAVAILHETLTARLAVAAVAVLGGVGLVISDRASPRPLKSPPDSV
jgi:drug/metabolite transporter (DMT)-like permease